MWLTDFVTYTCVNFRIGVGAQTYQQYGLDTQTTHLQQTDLFFFLFLNIHLLTEHTEPKRPKTRQLFFSLNPICHLHCAWFLEIQNIEFYIINPSAPCPIHCPLSRYYRWTLKRVHFFHILIPCPVHLSLRDFNYVCILPRLSLIPCSDKSLVFYTKLWMSEAFSLLWYSPINR